MTRKRKRLLIVAGGMGFVALAVLLVMFALSSDIAFFRTPSELAAERPAPATRIRLGGLSSRVGGPRQGHNRLLRRDSIAGTPSGWSASAIETARPRDAASAGLDGLPSLAPFALRWARAVRVRSEISRRSFSARAA